MKKLLSIAIALALTLSLSVTAFAEDTQITPDTDPTGSTNVTYTVDSAYIVTIPEGVTLDGNAVTVEAKGVKVAKGSAVVVELSGINVTSDTPDGDDEFTVALVDNADVKLAYTVSATGNIEGNESSTDDIVKGNTVLTVQSGLNNDTDNEGASTGSTELTFTLADDAEYAGSYSGNITFTVSVQ